MAEESIEESNAPAADPSPAAGKALANPGASQMAHDLANSLSGIGLLVESIQTGATYDSSLTRQLAALQNSTSHALQICRQLQAALRGEDIDAGQREAVNLTEIVSESRDLLHAKVGAAAEIVFDLQRSLPLVMANPTQLYRVLLDLTTNASEAFVGSREAAITIRTGVADGPGAAEFDAVAAEHKIDADGCVFLEVVDTGCGIAEDTLQRVFESSYTTKQGGQGLGLSSALQIVQSYGGGVAIASRPGRGTKVRCFFPPMPDAEADRLTAPALDSPTLVNGPPSPPITILLVEDVPSLRYLCKSLIESSEQFTATVVTASNGREALEAYRGRKSEISMVILDVILPDCKGTQLMRDIRRLSPDVPIVLASATPEDELIAQCGDCLPDGIVVKPFVTESLLRKIHSLL